MKIWRGGYDASFIRHIFYAYETNAISDNSCGNCPFYNGFDSDFDCYIAIDETPYVKTYDTGRIIHIDNIKKKCKICALYY